MIDLFLEEANGQLESVTRAIASGGWPAMRSRSPATKAAGKSVPGGSAKTREVWGSNMQQSLGLCDAFRPANIAPATVMDQTIGPTGFYHFIPQAIHAKYRLCYGG